MADLLRLLSSTALLRLSNTGRPSNTERPSSSPMGKLPAYTARLLLNSNTAHLLNRVMARLPLSSSMALPLSSNMVLLPLNNTALLLPSSMAHPNSKPTALLLHSSSTVRRRRPAVDPSSWVW